MARPETGLIQFGDDWPGIFMRGDNAASAAILLSEALSKVQRTGALNAIELSQLHGLARSLKSADVRVGVPVRLRSWSECLLTTAHIPEGLTPTRFEGPVVHPERVQGPSKILVESRGEGSWAIIWGWSGEVFNREGKWEYESSPSGRTDAFKVRARWKWDEVGEAVQKAVASFEGDWEANMKVYDDE